MGPGLREELEELEDPWIWLPCSGPGRGTARVDCADAGTGCWILGPFISIRRAFFKGSGKSSSKVSVKCFFKGYSTRQYLGLGFGAWQFRAQVKWTGFGVRSLGYNIRFELGNISGRGGYGCLDAVVRI